jgi:lipid II:glycine glycyltransferase (peptidoglycan interpeptide bridge formation enzyme)
MTDTMNHLSDVRQSTNYSKYLKSQGWIVERIKNTNYFIKKIPLLGSVLKVQRPINLDFETIQKLEKKYKTFQTIIEPNLSSIINSFSDIHKLILSQGFKLSKSPYLPSKTLHLDLNSSEKEIYNNFTKDCKYSIRKGERLKIIKYSTLKDIEFFHNGWRNSVNFSRFVPSLTSLINLKKSFPNNHSIFLASHNKIGNIIGRAIFTRSSHDFAYYWYGFTNNEGRTSLSQYSLLYSGILWGKKMGCKIFDFEGIYDSRFPNKSWLGFTHFKKSFGGKEILYPGCYTKLRFPL